MMSGATVRCGQPNVGVDQQHEVSGGPARQGRRTQRVSVGGRPLRVARIERPNERRQRPRLVADRLRSAEMRLKRFDSDLIDADSTTSSLSSKPLNEIFGDFDSHRHAGHSTVHQ